MVFNEAAVPADHRTVSNTTYHNCYFSNEAVTLTFTAGAADHYEVRNYYGTVVKTGPVTGTSLNLGIMPLGWYRLYLIRPTATVAPWLLAGGDTYFVVTRPDVTGMPARPALDAFRGADPYVAGMDFPAGGFTRMGPYRHTLNVGANHARDLAAAKDDLALEASTWGTPDPQRPLVRMSAYENGIGTADNAAVVSAVSQLVAAGCSIIEGKNEPNNGTPLPSTYITSEFANFSTQVRAGGGLVGGPCTITIEGAIDTSANTGLGWLQKFFVAGGDTMIDVLTFHNYNGVIGSLRLGRQTMDAFVSLITRYGQQNKPRFNTEAFSYFAQVYGSTEVRQQTQQTMLEMHLLEQYGLPKERTSNFYALSHGFWGYPSWWINLGNVRRTPNPIVAVVRVWSQELLNKAYAARLDFGSENDQMLGCRFTGPNGSVVTVQTDTREATIKCAVTGSTSVDTVDAWGNVTTRPVVGGVIDLPVDGLPAYVRCPLGVVATPVAADYGVDVTGPQAYLMSVTAPAAETGFPLTAPLDVTPTTYRASVASLPADWVMTFPKATRFDRVVVRTATPWQAEAGLLDFDVDAKIAGSWVTVGTFLEPTKTLTWASQEDVGRGFIDSFYSRKSCFVVELPDAVAATDIRIHVRDATYGGGTTLASTNGDGQAGGTTGLTGPRRLCLSVVRAYLSTQSDGGTAVAGQPMLLIT